MIESTSTRPDVRGFACRDESGRTVQLFLINKNAEATQLKVTLDDKPTADRSKVSAQVMKAPGKKLESLQVTSKGGHHTALLPPFSVCRLVFETK